MSETSLSIVKDISKTSELVTNHVAERVFRERAAKRLTGFVENLFAIAENPEDKNHFQALTYIFDRLIGRPAQAVDVTTNGKDFPGVNLEVKLIVDQTIDDYLSNSVNPANLSGQ